MSLKELSNLQDLLILHFQTTELYLPLSDTERFSIVRAIARIPQDQRETALKTKHKNFLRVSFLRILLKRYALRNIIKNRALFSTHPLQRLTKNVQSPILIYVI